MKLNKLFLGAIAALASAAMVACSDDAPDVNNGGENPDGDKYMAFTISNIGSSRAIADSPANYEDATGNEGEVTANNIYFLFYDANGAAFIMEGRTTINGTAENTNMVIPTDISKEVNATGNEEITGTLVLGKRTADPFIGVTPAQVLVVANPNTDAMSNLANKPLSDVLSVTTSYSGGWTSASNFLMTNSSYENGGKQVTAVDVTGNIMDSADDAEKNPAIINLERAVAKVRVAYNTSYDVINTEAPEGATEEQKKQFNLLTATGQITVNLKAKVYGWRLINWSNQCYGFKKLDVASYTGDAWNWNWNDLTYKRSYWAYSSASAAADFNNPYYDLYDNGQFLNKSFSTTTPEENIVYCYEHTRGTAATVTTRPKSGYDAVSAPTAICVKVEIGTETDGTFTALNMVKWAGKLYTVENFNKTVITNFIAQNPTVDETQLTVKYAEDDASKNTWKAVVHNAANNSNTTMDTYSNFLWWNNGLTSYWMNIEHFGGLFGVVRNHIYDYSITAINGLGIPGNNPETPLEEETYLAAALNILNWRIVNHNVTLE